MKSITSLIIAQPQIPAFSLFVLSQIYVCNVFFFSLAVEEDVLPV